VERSFNLPYHEKPQWDFKQLRFIFSKKTLWLQDGHRAWEGDKRSREIN
jgi:hypothetical protein